MRQITAEELKTVREIVAVVALHAGLSATISRDVPFGDSQIEALVRNSLKIGIEFAKQAEALDEHGKQ